MPSVPINGIDLFYEEEGSGEESIVFSHAGFFDRRMWAAQVEAFRGSYRCISYDHRGQGRSAVPSGRSIDHDLLAGDAAGLIEHLNAAPCHFVGISQGANIGFRLGLRRPDLLRSLVLLGLTVDQDQRFVRRFRLLAALLRLGGPALLGMVMPSMFGEPFMQDETRAEERETWRRRLKANGRAIHKTSRGIADRTALIDRLSELELPTLLIAGSEDEVAPPPKARLIQERIAGSELVVIPKAGHMSAIEQPAAVNDAIAGFLGLLGRQG